MLYYIEYSMSLHTRDFPSGVRAGSVPGHHCRAPGMLMSLPAESGTSCLCRRIGAMPHSAPWSPSANYLVPNIHTFSHPPSLQAAPSTM